MASHKTEILHWPDGGITALCSCGFSEELPPGHEGPARWRLRRHQKSCGVPFLFLDYPEEEFSEMVVPLFLEWYFRDAA